MEIKLKINVDKILAETGITIDKPEQWLALMQDGLDYFKFHNVNLTEKQEYKLNDLFNLFDNVMMLQSIRTKTFQKLVQNTD